MGDRGVALWRRSARILSIAGRWKALVGEMMGDRGLLRTGEIVSEGLARGPSLKMSRVRLGRYTESTSDVGQRIADAGRGPNLGYMDAI